MLAPTLVVAWMPYGYGPHGPGYGAGYPYSGPQAPASGPHGSDIGAGVPAPAYPPFGLGYQPDYPAPAAAGPAPAGSAPAYPPFQPPFGFPGADRPGFGPRSGFEIARETAEDAYILNIRLSGMKPQEVQVRTEGRWILVSKDRSLQQVQEDSFDDGRGYSRSFSYSSGTATRRFTVPRDADPAAMRREDSEGAVRIVIPRRQN